ncbi:MAG: hypothetical protein ACLQJ7_10235 [Syntrophobacteraceae bacterium]
MDTVPSGIEPVGFCLLPAPRDFPISMTFAPACKRTISKEEILWQNGSPADYNHKDCVDRQGTTKTTTGERNEKKQQGFNGGIFRGSHNGFHVSLGTTVSGRVVSGDRSRLHGFRFNQSIT